MFEYFQKSFSLYSLTLLFLYLIFTSCTGPYKHYPVQKRTDLPAPPLSYVAPPEALRPISLPNELQKQKKNKTLVVIDAGHGGEDFGTHSLQPPKYQEKYLNLATARMLKEYLQKLGYQVSMTRMDDTFITLDNRAFYANEKKSKIFVSVHYNSAPSKQAEGIEVYYYNSSPQEKRTVESRILAEKVLNKIIQNTEAKSRGIKHGDFAVIRKTHMPAILVEGGFLTNEGEMEKLKDPAYLKRIAWGITQGIDDYLKESVQGEEG